MREQAGQHMMAVLPDALGHDQRRVRVQLAKNLHAHLLRINEAVLLFAVIRMGAHHRPALGLERPGQRGLHLGLLGPAFLVGGKAQVAVGHQIDVFGFERSGFHSFHITNSPPAGKIPQSNRHRMAAILSHSAAAGSSCRGRKD